MQCSEKVAFPNRMSAETALAITKMQGRFKRSASLPKHVYACPWCGAWHLTKHDPASYEARKATLAATGGAITDTDPWMAEFTRKMLSEEFTHTNGGGR